MANRLVKIALIQHPPVFLNIEATMTKAENLLFEAAKQEAELVVFPETWFPGYPVWIDSAERAAIWGNPASAALYRILVENSITLDGPIFTRLCKMFAGAKLDGVVGVHELLGRSLYNTQIFITRKGNYKIHRKLTPTYTERMLWGQGDGSTISSMETPYGTVGGLICWEHWMPLARAAMHDTGEVIHVAQWPWVRELHEIASRQYAFEGQCFVAASGTVLTQGDVLDGFDSLGLDEPEARMLLENISPDRDELLQRGGSSIIAPDSSFVTKPVFDEPVTVYGTVNLDRVTEGHLLMDSTGHYSRPDIFKLVINESENRLVEKNKI